MFPLDEEKMTIAFTKPWGANDNGKSWRVTFSVEYDNERDPHVELTTDHEVQSKKIGTIYHAMKHGNKYKLVELHRIANTVAWCVEGLYKGEKGERAHFTVHHGNRAISVFLPVDDQLMPCEWGCNPPERIWMKTINRELQDVYTYFASSR